MTTRITSVLVASVTLLLASLILGQSVFASEITGTLSSDGSTGAGVSSQEARSEVSRTLGQATPRSQGTIEGTVVAGRESQSAAVGENSTEQSFAPLLLLTLVMIAIFLIPALFYFRNQKAGF